MSDTHEYQVRTWCVDRRPPGERNKNARQKLPGDMTVEGPDPLPAVKRLAAWLQQLTPEERSEIVLLRVKGPDPLDLVEPGPDDRGPTPASDVDPNQGETDG